MQKVSRSQCSIRRAAQARLSIRQRGSASPRGVGGTWAPHGGCGSQDRRRRRRGRAATAAEIGAGARRRTQRRTSTAEEAGTAAQRRPGQATAEGREGEGEQEVAADGRGIRLELERWAVSRLGQIAYIDLISNFRPIVLSVFFLFFNILNTTLMIAFKRLIARRWVIA